MNDFGDLENMRAGLAPKDSFLRKISLSQYLTALQLLLASAKLSGHALPDTIENVSKLADIGVKHLTSQEKTPNKIFDGMEALFTTLKMAGHSLPVIEAIGRYARAEYNLHGLNGMNRTSKLGQQMTLAMKMLKLGNAKNMSQANQGFKAFGALRKLTKKKPSGPSSPPRQSSHSSPPTPSSPPRRSKYNRLSE